MPRNGVSPWYSDWMCEEDAAPIARIPDAHGNSCEPGDQRSVEGILQQKSAVEPASTQLRGELPLSADFPAFARAGIGNHLIAKRFPRVQIGYPGPRQDCQMRLRKTPAHRPQRRQAHHGVANPVRGANEDARIHRPYSE